MATIARRLHALEQKAAKNKTMQFFLLPKGCDQSRAEIQGKIDDFIEAGMKTICYEIV